MSSKSLPELFFTRLRSANGWEDAIADSVHLRVGASPVVFGKTRSVETLRALIAGLSNRTIETYEVWTLGETIIIEADLSAPTGSTLTFPIITVARLDDRARAIDLRLHFDATVLQP